MIRRWERPWARGDTDDASTRAYGRLDLPVMVTRAREAYRNIRASWEIPRIMTTPAWESHLDIDTFCKSQGIGPYEDDEIPEREILREVERTLDEAKEEEAP